MSGLDVEQLWDAYEYASLEFKELGKQVTDGSEIYLTSG